MSSKRLFDFHELYMGNYHYTPKPIPEGHKRSKITGEIRIILPQEKEYKIPYDTHGITAYINGLLRIMGNSETPFHTMHTNSQAIPISLRGINQIRVPNALQTTALYLT